MIDTIKRAAPQRTRPEQEEESCGADPDDGGEATVSVGQSLKDYGTILAIYVNQGLVTTSSGRVISFKDNEY